MLKFVLASNKSFVLIMITKRQVNKDGTSDGSNCVMYYFFGYGIYNVTRPLKNVI